MILMLYNSFMITNNKNNLKPIKKSNNQSNQNVLIVKKILKNTNYQT